MTSSIRRRLSALLGAFRSPGASPSFARGALDALVIQGLGLLLAWIVQIALARAMPRAAFGIYTFVLSLMTTLAVPATLGLPVVLVRFLPEYRAGRDWPRYLGVLRRSQLLVLSAGLAVALGTGLTVLLFPSGAAAPALWAGLILTPILALSGLFLQILRGMGRIAQAVAPPALLQPALMLAVLGVLIWSGVRVGSMGAVVLLAGSSLAALGLQVFLVRARLLEEFGRQPISRSYETRRWLRAALPLLVGTGFQMLLAQMDILAVSALRSPSEVAVYGAAARVSRLIGFWTYGAYLALGPVLAAAHARGDLPAMQRAATATVRWTFAPSCVALAGLLLCGRPLLGLYGHGFEGGYGALCVLGLGFLVNTAAGPVMVILNMTGQERVVSWVSGWTALGAALLILPATAAFGLLGAAFVSALAMAVWNVWLGVLSQRCVGVNPFLWGKG